MTHIYAGARHKHSSTKGGNNLWNVTDDHKYLSLMKQYKKKIVLEIGAHDHWEDVRVISDASGPYRNLFVPTGISMKQGQMPGYNTLEISASGVASNISEVSMDITTTYGKKTVPALSTIPLYRTNYKDYGIDKLTPEAILAAYAKMEKGSFSDTEKFLSDKAGFNPTHADLLSQGEALVEGFGLINS